MEADVSITQPCVVQWHLTIVKEYTEDRYFGTVASIPTMESLLEALAAAVVVDEGERRQSNRQR